MSNRSKKINVLVVDDSAFMRKVVSDILNSDEDIKVIGTARDGKEAITKFKLLKPDLVTMDVEMPVMNGLVCIKEILKLYYVPILMISSHTRTGTDYTIEALENGAVDFISKPDNLMDMKSSIIRNELIEKIKISYTVREEENLITFKNKILKKKGELNSNSSNSTIEIPQSENGLPINKIIAIGISTGGPKSLQEIIPRLPKYLPAAVLIVQHMPAGFTKSLADRLNNTSDIIVKEAEDMEKIKGGTVYIAPGDFHMMVERHPKDLIIRLTKDPPIGRLRPAVDILYQSLSDTRLRNIVAIIMTGMGSDGSDGIKKLKLLNDSHTIAQDQKTCTVFGMPKMAIQTGMIDKVLSLEEIPDEIIKIARGEV